MESLFGSAVWSELRGKVVLDFGCGRGKECIEIARRGARRVIGIDIREDILTEARCAADCAKVSERCHFSNQSNEKADVIISIDAFEHFSDPATILQTMAAMLLDHGKVLVSFGPPWYHPRGGHFFSVFPWAHLVFTEWALVRWRSDLKSDGATRFSEVAGGLNKMTVARFKSLVNNSPLIFDYFEAVPLKRLRWLWNPLTAEFLTSTVRCKLALRRGSQGGESLLPQ